MSHIIKIAWCKIFADKNKNGTAKVLLGHFNFPLKHIWKQYIYHVYINFVMIYESSTSSDSISGSSHIVLHFFCKILWYSLFYPRPVLGSGYCWVGGYCCLCGWVGYAFILIRLIQIRAVISIPKAVAYDIRSSMLCQYHSI